MAPLVTHLVVGERASLHCCDSLIQRPTVRSFSAAFWSTCTALAISTGARRTLGRLHEDGEDAFRKSCTNFLAQLDALLVHPWRELTQEERAFVAGYLCHLTVDEVSKQSSCPDWGTFNDENTCARGALPHGTGYGTLWRNGWSEVGLCLVPRA